MKYPDRMCEKYSALLALREFATDEAVRDALQPGTLFYMTMTWHGRPNSVTGPYVVKDVWRQTDQGICIHIGRADSKFGKVEYLHDMQNHVGNGIFTTGERARAYLEACRGVYKHDLEWQTSVAVWEANRRRIAPVANPHR